MSGQERMLKEKARNPMIAEARDSVEKVWAIMQAREKADQLMKEYQTDKKRIDQIERADQQVYKAQKEVKDIFERIYKNPQQARENFEKAYEKTFHAPDFAKAANDLKKQIAERPQDFGQVHGRSFVGIPNGERRASMNYARNAAENLMVQRNRAQTQTTPPAEYKKMLDRANEKLAQSEKLLQQNSTQELRRMTLIANEKLGHLLPGETKNWNRNQQSVASKIQTEAAKMQQTEKQAARVTRSAAVAR